MHIRTQACMVCPGPAVCGATPRAATSTLLLHAMLCPVRFCYLKNFLASMLRRYGLCCCGLAGWQAAARADMLLQAAAESKRSRLGACVAGAGREVKGKATRQLHIGAMQG